jgi:hypothetical protein
MAGKDTALAFRVFVPDESGAMQDFAAGTSKSDMPSWAVKAIKNPKAWDDFDPDAEGDDSGDGSDEPTPYAKWLKADLEAEVAKRNEARDDDDQIEVGGTGTVKDLAAALDADDAAGA